MDSRRKKVLVVLSVGSVILIWRLYVLATEYLPKSVDSHAALPADQSAVTADSMNVAVELEEMWLAQARAAELPWGRDPFSDVAGTWRESPESRNDAQSLGGGAPKAPELSLTGVSVSGERWLAAIGGRIVGVGDIVEENFNVEHIDAKSVVLARNGWVFLYTLGAKEVVIRRQSEQQ